MMNPLMRLLIPLVLGFGAAAVNWMVIENRTASRPFVSIKEGVRAGEIIESAMLGRVDLPGDPGLLGKSLIPFSERDLVVGTLAQRDLFPGDFLLWQDSKRPGSFIATEEGERILPVDIGGLAVETSLLYPGSLIDFWIAPAANGGFGILAAGGVENTKQDGNRQRADDSNKSRYQLIGPFRILSVGSEFNQPLAGVERKRTAGTRGNERVISVAVKVLPDNTYDDASRQLLDAHAQKRLMAIALRPQPTHHARPTTPVAPMPITKLEGANFGK